MLGVGERTLRLSAGELVVLPPALDHELLEASADLSLFVLALTPGLAAKVFDRPAHAAEPQRAFETVGCREPESYFSALSEVRDGASVERALADLFKSTLRASKVRHVLSRRALLAWEKEQSLTETALAARLRVDLGTLSRCLRSDLGARFVEYRSRHRLMRFVSLADGGLPLTAAALEAGFGSYAQCHRVFSRLVGCSPTAYFDGKRAAIAELVAATDKSTLRAR